MREIVQEEWEKDNSELWRNKVIVPGPVTGGFSHRQQVSSGFQKVPLHLMNIIVELFEASGIFVGVGTSPVPPGLLNIR